MVPSYHGHGGYRGHGRPVTVVLNPAEGYAWGMNPLLVDVPSTAHGHLRLRYAGTLYLRALLAHPEGFEHYEHLHPRHRFPEMSRVIGHVPLGEEPLQGAPEHASAPCLDIWVCCREDNPHTQVPVGTPLVELNRWQEQSEPFRRNDLRQVGLPQEAVPVEDSDSTKRPRLGH